MKTHYFLLIAAVSFFSCTKDKNTYIISGKILQDCNGTPFANQQLSFFQSISSTITSTSGGELGTATTDANGNFSFSYTPANNEEIKILTPSGAGFGTLMGGIPKGINIEGLIIYTSPRFNMKVSINVINPHSAGDTLYILDLRNNQVLKVASPLTSGHLYTASSIPLPAMGYRESAIEMRWYFKSSPNPIRYQNIPISKYCKDTINAVIEMN